ncbi:hypothetical protein GGF32_008840 [Allomyces javanicus]|nr:hypothetical protein GGF32_008840 [Allomyces javanicus]
MAQDLTPPATAPPSTPSPAAAQAPTRPSADNAPDALEEVELMPGVYLVKRPAASSSSTAASPAPQSEWERQYTQALHDLDTESLEGEYRALVTSARHLDRSNREMEEYAASEDDDAARAELSAIIAENGPVLVRLVQKAHIVRESLTRRGVDVDHLLGTITVPGTVATTTVTTASSQGTPASPPAAQAVGTNEPQSPATVTAEEPDEEGIFL